jgi:hypothetical protein
MNRRNTVVLFSSTALGIAFLLPGNVVAQTKSLREQLVGTWMLVTAETTAQDGTKNALFGTSPKGIVMFDAGGRFAQIQVRADRPKFKANNRLQGTPEENKAALAGGVGQFGTWAINEADSSLSVHMEAVVHYPNEEGTDQKRLVSLTADELKIINPLTGDGGRAELVYKRTK